MVRRQEGMASIVVVSILVIIMTLISIGFARLMNRNLNNSATRQFSTQATYAAQSGINDVSSYLRQYVQNNPGYTTLPYSKKCNGAGSLIGSSAAPGPFYNDSNLAQDSGRSTQYTCLLLDPQPQNLLYNQVLPGKSQVVKLNTSAFPGSLDKIMLSWQPPAISGATSYPPDCPGSPGVCTSTNLLDVTTWNDNSHQYVPMLRLTIYPVPIYPASASASNLQANSKTIFLYPESVSGNVPVKDFASLVDGSILPVHCSTTVGSTAGVPDFNDIAEYKCNIIINTLSSIFAAPDKLDYTYLRMTPIYNQADLQIKANDQWGQKLNFINVQAVVDVTAQTGGVAKRLKATVDTSSLSSTSNGIDTNVSSATDSIPEQALRTNVAICKRIVQTVSFFSYVSFDDPSSICHDSAGGGGGGISSPSPTLTFSINGAQADASDGVHSGDNTPGGSAYYGVSYIGAGGSANLHWQTVHATSCTASDGWGGNPGYAITNAATETGQGNQTFGGITNVTKYTLFCSRVDAAGTVNTSSQTLTAWPPPRTTVTGPGAIRAGGPYTLNWSSENAIRCVLSGDWNDNSQTATSGGQTMTWPVNDNSSIRRFTTTCFDPSGRSEAKTWTVTPNRPECLSSGTCVDAPICSASASFSGSSTEDATINWSTNCDNWDAANPCQFSRHIDSNIPGIGNQDGSPCYLASGSVRISSPGDYYFQIYVWATPWADQGGASGYGSGSGPGLANSGRPTQTVDPPYDPVRITSYNAGIWDNGPNRCAHVPATVGYWDTWTCRNNQFELRFGPPQCPDQTHRFVACPGQTRYTISGSANTTCTFTTQFGAFHSQTYSWGFSGSGGWSNGGTLGWGEEGWPEQNPNGNWFLWCDNGRTSDWRAS